MSSGEASWGKDEGSEAWDRRDGVARFKVSFGETQGCSPPATRERGLERRADETTAQRKAGRQRNGCAL